MELSDKKEAAYRHNYFHFNERLLERYGMEITFEDYINLCRQPPIASKVIDRHTKYVIVSYKDIKILAVKERDKSRRLKTALPKRMRKKIISLFNK